MLEISGTYECSTHIICHAVLTSGERGYLRFSIEILYTTLVYNIFYIALYEVRYEVKVKISLYPKLRKSEKIL